MIATTSTPAERKARAETILNQLGAGRFIAMTGAKDFLCGENYLQFGLPSKFAKSGINKVKIELTPADTYTIFFYACNFRKHTFETIAEVSNVYAEDLQSIFTEHTGLDTYL